jgi:UDP-glucose 4-epimerase
MSHVLVTGGSGFIGSTLVDRLLEEQHEVTVVDDLSTGSLDNLRQARDRAGDRLDVVQLDIAVDGLEDVVARSRPAVVAHLAAQADVRRSVADPVRDAMVNLVGTVRLLEACRRHDVGKVVFATSGGTIYGEPAADELPVPETYDGHPRSPYGASKRSVEEYLHTYEALYGLRWTALALANVYGPRQSPEGEAGVVSIFGGRMLAGGAVTIYGDGEQTRDFVHVDDVVDAFVRAMGAGDGLRCNIGTGEQTSVNELFAELAGLVGYDREPEYAPARAGELQRAALDVSRAAAELGWKPRTSLREGLAGTLEWLRS